MPEPTPTSTQDLQAYAANQRAAAARIIAGHLPDAAQKIMVQIKTASQREQADLAKNRAIAFGVMLDKLDQLTGTKQQGRYGSQSDAADPQVDLDALTRWTLPAPTSDSTNGFAPAPTTEPTIPPTPASSRSTSARTVVPRP